MSHRGKLGASGTMGPETEPLLQSLSRLEPSVRGSAGIEGDAESGA
jgi:hypothetical protein